MGGAGRAFRTDIEGLRAVAVLAVVLYHAGLPGAGGGYVGVDVFFVLSGFLITGLLWDELRRTGRIAYASFYARRARRLLPAAVVVLLATVAAATVWLPALQARVADKDALAAALYVANYRFAAMRTDYLTSDAPPSPLQHYWSLGVEEQFYALWPLLLAAAFAVARHVTRPAPRSPAWVASAVLALVAVSSFAASAWLTRVAQPWAFFSLPTRAWELGIGGLAALTVPLLRRMPKAAAAALGWLGLAAIVWSVARLGDTTPFPGVAALAPAGGALALLSAGCAAPRLGPDALLLRRRPFQLGGKISYSWYLWHWPILLLAPVVAGRPLELPARLALAALSGVLAWLTVRVIEDPVRFSSWLRTPPRRSLAAGAALTMVAAASTVAAAGWLPTPRGAAAGTAAIGTARTGTAGGRGTDDAASVAQRSVAATVAKAVAARDVPANIDPPLERAYGDKARPFVDGCHAGFTDAAVRPCVYGDKRSTTTVVLFGDSHAGQWFPALDGAAKARRWRLVSLTKSTCPPVTIALWSPVLHRPYQECDRWRAAALGRIRAERPVLVVMGIARHYGPEYRFGRVYSPAWVAGLADMVRRVRATGTGVVVLGPTPRPKGSTPDCLSDHLDDAVACVQPLARAVNATGVGAERAAVTGAGGGYLDVAPWLCTPSTCAVVVGNLLVYRDDNHVSRSYAEWLAPVLGAHLDRASGRRAPPERAGRDRPAPRPGTGAARTG